MKKYFCSAVFALLALAGGSASAQSTGQSAQQANGGCDTALDRCAPVPTPKACPVGQKWSLAGSGIAHCVNEDPTCTGNTELYHDYMGNPSCVPPVVTSEERDTGCPAGYSGYKTQSRTVSTYPSGRVVYGSWKTIDNECVKDAPPPTPTCANGASDYPTCTPTPTPTCSNGATNYPTCTVTGSCSNGGTDYPICTPPGGGGGTPSCAASQVWDGTSCVNRCSGTDVWNGSTCVGQPASCPTHNVPSTQSCPLGQTGSLSFTNVVDCNGNVLSTTQTGGSCTVIPTPPPDPTCDSAYGPVPVGSSGTACDFFYQQYPQGQRMTCTPRGWAVSGGNPNLMIDCE